MSQAKSCPLCGWYSVDTGLSRCPECETKLEESLGLLMKNTEDLPSPGPVRKVRKEPRSHFVE